MAEKETRVLSGLEKAKLQAIISDVKFVNDTEADSYRCNNCSSIAIYHYIANCSHVFCGKCHGQYFSKPCPVNNCNNTLIDKITQNLDFEFGMYSLKIYCTFLDNGCEDIIELSSLMGHQSTCKFSTKNLLPRLWNPSPLQKLEEEMFSLKNAIKDVLDVNDQFRNILEGNIEKISEKMENSFLFQKELQSDLDKLANKGKEENEKLIKEIEQLKLTNNEMMQEINSLQIQLKEQADVLRLQFQEIYANTQKFYEFTWIITNFSKIKLLNDPLTTDFITNDCKCKITTKFYLDLKAYWVSTTCAPYEIECNAPEYIHKTIIYIFDQSNQENLRHITRIEGPSFGWCNTENNVLIFPSYITKNYIKNDSIVIKIIIEPFFSNYKYSTCSQNGILIWKIDNYTKRKQAEIDGITRGIYSNYFLSSKEGYRMQLEFTFDKSKDVIAIQLIFVLGEFDHILDKKFIHKTTFAIVDQSDKVNKTHLLKTVESDCTILDRVEFSPENLENCTYLKNDSMVVKVDVESF